MLSKRFQMLGVWVVVGLLTLAATTGASEKPEAIVAKLRQRCMEILNSAMQSEEAFIRSGAVRAAGESLDPDMIPLILRATQDFYPTTRLFALQALKEISPEEKLKVARIMIDDSNVWVRAAALETLADQQDKESITRIREKLKSPDRMDRLAAAYALFRLGEENYYEDLVGSLKGGDVVHRYQAISYLGKIGDAASLTHMGTLLEGKEEEIVSYTLQSLGEKADITLKRVLIRLSLSANPAVRHKAVLAMGYLPPAAVLKELKSFCEDADPVVRLSAAVSFNRLGSKNCQAVFGDLLGHPDFGVRSITARILGELDLPDKASLLRQVLKDSVVRVRTAAVRSAGKIGGSQAFELLLPMLEDPEEVIRVYAAGNLIKVMR